MGRTVRQFMVISRPSTWDYSESSETNNARNETAFLLAVNEAMTRLVNPVAKFHVNLERCLIEYDVDTEEYRGGGRDLRIGCQVVSHVSRGGISAGDVGFVIANDVLPIGQVAIVMFAPPNTGYATGQFHYLAMMPGEYDMSGVDLDRERAKQANTPDDIPF